MNIKDTIKSMFNLYALIGLLVGMIAGYVYYSQVGCSSGSCAIWSSPWKSVIWGGIFGYLLGDFFKRPRKETKS